MSRKGLIEYMTFTKNQHNEDLIHRFLSGNLTSREEKEFYSWINESPANRSHWFREKDLWEATLIGSERLNATELEEWIKLREKINHRKLTIQKYKNWVKIAAIVIISVGLGWFAHSAVSRMELHSITAERKTVETSKGQMKEIFLADGTHVWLNADSRLSFPSHFNARNRKVNLRGEAYFKVTANENLPFLVQTLNHRVKVTGTQFNVCEYPESKIIETTLVKGKVKVITGNIVKDLFPGEQSSFNTETARIRISKADFEVNTSWKEGRYEFKNEPVSKIFQIIERWWDVKIIYPENEISNERISGVLRNYKPLEQHFEVIKQLVPIEYTINHDLITIHVK